MTDPDNSVSDASSTITYPRSNKEAHQQALKAQGSSFRNQDNLKKAKTTEIEQDDLQFDQKVLARKSVPAILVADIERYNDRDDRDTES